MINEKKPLPISVWQMGENEMFLPALNQNMITDVCIVGGGMVGLSCAYLLAKAGKSIVLLESGMIAEGESCRTTAHLTNIVDWGYHDITHFHGEETARLVAESHTAALQKIESIITENNIDCDFEKKDGYLYLAPGEVHKNLEKELESIQKTGLIPVEKTLKLPLSFFESGPALCFKNQAQFNPVKYMRSLAQLIQRFGGKIFISSRVSHFEGTDKLTVTTDKNFAVTAESLIIATNTPINDRVVMHTKLASYRSYVIGATVPKNSIPHALYWEKTSSPESFHYMRLQKSPNVDQEILIVGGEDHKSGQANDAEERYRSLETWARGIFPMIQSVDFCWSGQIMQSCDGLAFIGRNPLDKGNIYVATADCGTGMTYAAIAAMLLTDLIFKRRNPWENIYDPARKTLRAAWNFTRENSNVIWQYADWFTHGQVSSSEKIKPGEGAIVRSGLHKLAVYRDEFDDLHIHSAVCPHLGGIVKWNEAEKSWDCPCHGSRFDCYGKVIHGPALANLATQKLSDDIERIYKTNPHSLIKKEKNQP